ncbi:MAG: hypothetical protein QNK42_00270, partial [Pseudodonghicola sp.]|nr:hypothetical protein [Pseudodonghicola sp.]
GGPWYDLPFRHPASTGSVAFSALQIMGGVFHALEDFSQITDITCQQKGELCKKQVTERFAEGK